jgi:hypothetical protein
MGRATAAPYLIRPHQPGNLGWVVAQHGLVYANELPFLLDETPEEPTSSGA